jgi:glutathione S-transferase
MSVSSAGAELGAVMTKYILWGLVASPYQLKMQALLDAAGQPWERWPDQAGRARALVTGWRLQRAKRQRAIKRFPAMSAELDEYPAVPFYTLDRRNFFYDSSALVEHMAHLAPHDRGLLPHTPRLAFMCRLIDEAFDEFGLYMVHHMRWVGSARTTPMGVVTARELRAVIPPGMQTLVARRLARRQVARCPYLFSVAPPGYDAGVDRDRTPPSRDGFPATHALLDAAWCEYVMAMEALLLQQPYLLGERFTLADASAYGQLGMNLIDPEAIGRLQDMAPRTFAWLCAIRDGKHRHATGEAMLQPALQPLLQVISQTFVPLMVQNENAYLKARMAGETLFNEAAFNCNRALYDGELLAQPFRAVIKTFQVRVWRELKAAWWALDALDRCVLQRDFLPDADKLFAVSGADG